MKTAVFLSLLTMIFLAGMSCSSKMSEKELFDLATQYMEQENFEKAAEFYARVYKEYPDGENSAKALFMMGFLNANHLNNFDQAKVYYEDFLGKYPEHELAIAAQYEMENMGKSPDELPFLMDGQPSDSENNSEAGGQQAPAVSN